AARGGGRSGFTNLVPTTGDPTVRSGRSGAEAHDERVTSFLGSLHPDRAATYAKQGYAAALHSAPHVVDFLVRPGPSSANAFEAFVHAAGLGAADAIRALDVLLAGRPGMTIEQLNGFTRQLRDPVKLAKSRPVTRAELVAAAVELAGEPRYAAQPARA